MVNLWRHQDINSSFAVTVVREIRRTTGHRCLRAVLGLGATLILTDRYDNMLLNIKTLRNKAKNMHTNKM